MTLQCGTVCVMYKDTTVNLSLDFGRFEINNEYIEVSNSKKTFYKPWGHLNFGSLLMVSRH